MTVVDEIIKFCKERAEYWQIIAEMHLAESKTGRGGRRASEERRSKEASKISERYLKVAKSKKTVKMLMSLAEEQFKKQRYRKTPYLIRMGSFGKKVAIGIGKFDVRPTVCLGLSRTMKASEVVVKGREIDYWRIAPISWDDV